MYCAGKDNVMHRSVDSWIQKWVVPVEEGDPGRRGMRW